MGEIVDLEGNELIANRRATRYEGYKGAPCSVDQERERVPCMCRVSADPE